MKDVKSFCLKGIDCGVGLILHGSKDGTIRIYEINSREGGGNNFLIQKAGQYSCGTSPSEITSCTFVENRFNIADGIVPSTQFHNYNTESKSAAKNKMRLLGHVVASNAREWTSIIF